MSAEGMRDGCDDADLADAVGELEATRGFAALMFDLDQRTELLHLFEDLIERDHHFRRPHPVFFQRHELDEAQHHAFVTCKFSEGDDLIFVETAQQNTVHFYRRESRSFRGANARQALFVAIVDTSDAGEL